MQPRSPHSGASPEQLQSLRGIRNVLLDLHRALLDVERRVYEESFDTPSPYQLLRLLTESPQFAWLRPISGIVAEMDDMLEAEPPVSAVLVHEIIDRLVLMIRLDGPVSGFNQRYREALQQSVDVAGLHADLRRMLGRVVVIRR